jgi:hypothetical protein
VELPCQIDDEAAAAAFHPKKRRLTIELPVIERPERPSSPNERAP